MLLQILTIFFLFFILSIIFAHFKDYISNLNTKPELYPQLNINALKYLNFEYFIEKFGDMDIFITHSKSNSIDMLGNVKKVKFKDYYNDIMKQDPKWYFKTEDEYDFLSLLGIKYDIINEFDKIFKNDNFIFKNTSLQGKKKIMFVSPEYDDCMYEKKIFIEGARWSEIDFKCVDYEKFPKFKNAKIETYILNQGDGIYIPKNWWHCVENLEDSIGITYKIFRKSYLSTIITEKIREIYHILKNSECYDLTKIIKDQLTNEEYTKYKKKIIDYNKKMRK